MRQIAFLLSGHGKVVAWNDLPLDTIATLLATDFQNGLSMEEAAARCRIIHRRNSAWHVPRLVFGMLFRIGSSAKNVTVVRDGRPRTISPSNIVPGDIIELSCGEKAPSDGRLISSEGFSWRLGRTLQSAETPQCLDEKILIRKGVVILSGRARMVSLSGVEAGN